MTTSVTLSSKSSKEYILQYLLKQGKATAPKIAKALDISTQATRRHLNDLESEGLIDHHTIQIKMGRPQNEYYLTDKGRNRFPNRYGEFAVSFLDSLAETMGETQVRKVLEKQWERKRNEYAQILNSHSLEERITKLVEIRQQEGYMSEFSYLHQDYSQKKQFLITEHNCAIVDVSGSYPQVCEHELEMFASLFPDCTVERTNWLNNGEHRCGYLFTKN
jgi:DeoR family suf operon transcriptional repressor